MNDSSDQPSRGWSRLRQLMLTLAIVATAIALFYTEEDWRGKRDWERYKSELEAQGWMLDWNQRIPKPVPDDQNFFMASTNIRIRFVKTQNDAEYAAATNLNWLVPNYQGMPDVTFAKSNEPVVAELTVVPTGGNIMVSEGTTTVDLRDAAAGKTLQDLIRGHFGRWLSGSAGFHLVEKYPYEVPSLRITLKSESAQTADSLKQFIPLNLATNIGTLGITAGDQAGQFEVRLVSGRHTSAADYLAWSDQFNPAFDEIREALKRPYALIPGDYSKPWYRPIPNFVVLRWIAQMQAMRAQSHLLLNQPGEAVNDLSMVHDICQIVEHRPDGHPMTLVEAMINTAIHGVYLAGVQDGFRLHAWREEDLAALQKELEQTDLHTPVFAGFEFEEMAAVWNGERPDFMKNIVSERKIYGQPITFRDRLQVWAYRAMPQGWSYENVKVAVELDQKSFKALSRTNEQAFPAAVQQIETETGDVLSRNSPFTMLASIAVPNFIKAFETYAYTQTLVNEGQIACALERYKMVNGSYPDALDKLTPNFIDTLPVDIIGGQPLQYRRVNDGSFLLYSVGWNEKDDGGTVALDHQGKEDRNQGDWVWHYQAN